MHVSAILYVSFPLGVYCIDRILVAAYYSKYKCSFLCFCTVYCPGYWPSTFHVCGYWNLPIEWQFSCKECAEISVSTSSENLSMKAELCSAHSELQQFLNAPASLPPVFIGLSSMGRHVFFKFIE